MNSDLAIDTTVDLVTPENIAFRYQIAGPFRRFPAFLIDTIIKYTTAFICAMALFAMGMEFGSLGGHFAFGLSLLLFFAIEWFYGFFFEALCNGKTLGKMVLGIRVVSIDGKPISAVQAMLRNLVRLADLYPMIGPQHLGIDSPAPIYFPICTMGMIVMMSNHRMGRLGDLAAGTMVIIDEKKWRLPVATFDDPRVPALAGFIPADFRASRTLCRALAQYVERRTFFPVPRRRELSRRLADRLLERFGFARNIDPDLLLCSLYWKLFLADESAITADVSQFASPFLKDQPLS
jgi:uncharacterized RDD family membrane protein YckC